MMSTPTNTAAADAAISGERSFFEQQRAALVSDISLAMEHVLMNLNTLNRSMEGVIAVGREFEAVEALWSQFEGVMGRDPGAEKAGAAAPAAAAGEGEGEDTGERS